MLHTQARAPRARRAARRCDARERRQLLVREIYSTIDKALHSRLTLVF